jgi:hypothetical protein
MKYSTIQLARALTKKFHNICLCFLCSFPFLSEFRNGLLLGSFLYRIWFLLHQQKFHAASSHWWHVNPSPLQKRTSCNTFASLVREPGTSTNQINQDTSTPTFMFGCCICLEQQCFIVRWQVFFHIQVSCCIHHKWILKRRNNWQPYKAVSCPKWRSCNWMFFAASGPND